MGFELVSVAEPDLMANDSTPHSGTADDGAVAQYEKYQIALKSFMARGCASGRKRDGAKGESLFWITRANRRPWNV